MRGTLRDVAVEDPTGHALDAFFAPSLAPTGKKPGAVTRILHYGDSAIASDYVSGTVRRRLQARFGDAGHGFILIANPWEWYFHNDVSHGATANGRPAASPARSRRDGMYGLGGVSFTSYGGGSASFGTTTHGDYGRNVSRFDLYYLEQPGGGDVDLAVRGAPPERFSTRGTRRSSRVHSVHVPDGEAKLTRARGGRRPRAPVRRGARARRAGGRLRRARLARGDGRLLAAP